MSSHIQRFVDRLQGHEARGSKDFIMSLSDAKNLHADITRLLVTLQQFQEQAIKTAESDQVSTVQINGGEF
jgi:hypothetical protein